MQQQLAALKYYPGPADGQFGADTLEAVWAFQEVQGLPEQDTVSSAMQHALASPRSPAVLVPGGGSLRIEISLAAQVLVLYRGNQVALISHVSTGGGYYYCSLPGQALTSSRERDLTSRAGVANGSGEGTSMDKPLM